MSNDEMKELLSQAANAVQAALILAARVRRSAGDQADDAVQLESAVDRAARALKRLSPEGER